MSSEISRPLSVSSEDRVGPLSFSVEIRGGRTGFRRRPILADRFLIGSDPVCDLRLDNRLAAPLHCLLRRDGDCLEVERLTESPILVNGVPVDHAEVGDGDTLGIGSVRLAVHSHSIRFDIVRAAEDLSERAAAETANGTQSAARSAADVVDLIEVEQDRIREFDERRNAGAAALLAALQKRKRPASEALAAPVAAAESLVSRLGQLATVIERQTSRRLTDEHDVREAAADLLAAQRELLGQADRLLRLAHSVVEASRAASRRAG